MKRDSCSVDLFNIATSEHPLHARARQAGIDVNRGVGISVEAAGIVDRQRWFVGRQMHRDIAERHAQVRMRAAAGVYFARADQWAGGDSGRENRLRFWYFRTRRLARAKRCLQGTFYGPQIYIVITLIPDAACPSLGLGICMLTAGLE